MQTIVLTGVRAVCCGSGSTVWPQRETICVSVYTFSNKKYGCVFLNLCVCDEAVLKGICKGAFEQKRLPTQQFDFLHSIL